LRHYLPIPQADGSLQQTTVGVARSANYLLILWEVHLPMLGYVILAEIVVAIIWSTIFIPLAIILAIIGIIGLFFQIDHSNISPFEVFLSVMSACGGIFASGYLVKSLIEVLNGQSPDFHMAQLLAALGASLATWELSKRTGMETAVMLCLPMWGMAAHLVFLILRPAWRIGGVR
jgi:hypothetical protein